MKKKIYSFYKNFIFRSNLCLINSPLQFINLAEFLNQKKENDKKILILVGFANKASIEQIKNINLNFFFYKNLFFLSELFTLRKFRFVLYIRKFFKFNKVIIGDINYYLFKEFYKNSIKNIILDDGTASLQYGQYEEQIIFKKNSILFSIFKKIKLKKKIKIYNNDLRVLKSLSKHKKVDNNKVFIIGSASIERKNLNHNYFKKIINQIIIKYKNKKIYYIPHRLEKDLKYILTKNISIKRFNIPIELALTKEKFLPKYVLSFYSTALFNLKHIYKNQVKFYNIGYDYKSIKRFIVKTRHEKIAEQLKLHSINNLKF